MVGLAKVLTVLLVTVACIWALGCLGGVGIGVHHLLKTVQEMENPCTMTFMWPNYYPLSMVNRSRLHYKYRLFQFSHLELTQEEMEHKSDKVVIFIPGSSGSYGQVRSIGKEVTQKIIDRNEKKSEVAFYTLDFDEEPSGLNGLFIEQQSEFLQDCLRYIAELHNTTANQPPLRIVLFAHSMGGIVARHRISEMDEQNDPLGKSILGLISLSSPHRAPVLGVDMVMYKLYQDLEQHQDDRRSYISVAGGYRDILVRGELTPLNRKRYPRSASTLTAQLSSVEMSMDHLAILWCNELMLELTDHVYAMFNGAHEEMLQDLNQKQFKVPKTGFTRESFRKFGLKGEPGWLVADIITRKYIMSSFNYMFAGSVLLLAHGAGVQWKQLFVVPVLAYVLFISEDRNRENVLNAIAPLVLFSACLGVLGLVLLVAQVAKGIRLLTGLALNLGFLGLFGYHQYLSGTFFEMPGWEDILALIFIYVYGGTALLAVANMGSNIFAPRKEGGLFDADHYQIMIGMMYLPALSAWISPLLFALSIVKPVLDFEQVYPASRDQHSRGVNHPFPSEKLPEQLQHPLANEILKTIFQENRKTDVIEFSFLVISLVTMLPVFIHLWVTFFNPIHASSEKVLDSQYEKVYNNRKTHQEPVTSKKDDEEGGKTNGNVRRRKNRTTKGQEPSKVKAVEREDGVLTFEDDPIIVHDSKVLYLANGEQIQIDDLEEINPGKDCLPDAVPLIEDSSSMGNGKGVSHVLVQRVRSAALAFPDSLVVRSSLTLVAFVSLLLSLSLIFGLQFLACFVAVLCLFFRKESMPVERVVYKKV